MGDEEMDSGRWKGGKIKKISWWTYSSAVNLVIFATEPHVSFTPTIFPGLRFAIAAMVTESRSTPLHWPGKL